VCVKQVTALHDIHPNLVFTWRQQVRKGRLATQQVPMFIPIEVARTAPSRRSAVLSARPSRAVSADRIGIGLGDASRVRVEVKILFWGGQGLVLYEKGLGAAISFGPAEGLLYRTDIGAALLLIEGIDWCMLARTWRPEMADPAAAYFA
jgi:hypothetical protein